MPRESTEKSLLRRSWRTGWIECLHGFASADFQRRVWVEGSIEDCVSSYVECMCCYFDDLALDDGYQPRLTEGLVSEKEVAILSAFHERAGREDVNALDDLSDEEILEHRAWREVVELAIAAWHALRAEFSDPEDLARMDAVESSYGRIPVGEGARQGG